MTFITVSPIRHIEEEEYSPGVVCMKEVQRKQRSFPKYGSIWLRIEEIVLPSSPMVSYTPKEELTYPVLEASVLYMTPPKYLPHKTNWTWNEMVPYITPNERNWVRQLSSGSKDQKYHFDLIKPSVMLLHGTNQHAGHFNRTMPTGVTYLLSKVRANELRPISNLPTTTKSISISAHDARRMLMAKEYTTLPLAG